MCPSYPTVLLYMGRMGQSYGIPCVPLYRPILCVRPIPLSYMGQMGQSYGYPCVPLYNTKRIFSKRETRVNAPLNAFYSNANAFALYLISEGYCMCPSYPTVLLYMGRMGQSYGIPCVPLYRPILCVRPIPLSTDGAVLWNPMCTTVQANPMCPSYPTVLHGTDGTVLWNPMCTTVQLIILINSRRACTVRVTVLGLCVCLSVCVSRTILALQATR